MEVTSQVGTLLPLPMDQENYIATAIHFGWKKITRDALRFHFKWKRCF